MLKQSDFYRDRDLHRIDLGNGISLRGVSIAGINTHISVPELKICFDVGYSHPSLLHHKKYFITHSHMDHASGIPYIISNKSLTKQVGAEFYMPDAMIEPMDLIMNTWASLEGHDYEWNFRSASTEEDLIVNPSWVVRSFPTFHRVKSNGYCLFSRKTKLKPEYSHLNGEDLRSLKEKGQRIDEDIDKPILAVTGDTKIEFLDASPYLNEVEYLVVESTYASSIKSIESCREWGHIHFDEILPRLEAFKGKNIILKHFSRRHHFKEVLKILDEKVQDKELRSKLLVLPF